MSSFETPLPPPVESTQELPSVRSTRVLRHFLSRWYVAFSASSVFVVVAHLLIKAGLMHTSTATADAALGMRLLHALRQPEVGAGLLIYCLGSVCWMAAVAQQEISFLYPLSSVNHVLIVAGSAVFFRESVSVERACGVAFIVLGMIVMTGQAGNGAT